MRKVINYINQLYSLYAKNPNKIIIFTFFAIFITYFFGIFSFQVSFSSLAKDFLLFLGVLSWSLNFGIEVESIFLLFFVLSELRSKS
jgi:hypothetical protein